MAAERCHRTVPIVFIFRRAGPWPRTVQQRPELRFSGLDQPELFAKRDRLVHLRGRNHGDTGGCRRRPREDVQIGVCLQQKQSQWKFRRDTVGLAEPRW